MIKACRLWLGQIDAHGLCRHLIVPDGLKGPAVGGVDQQQNDGDADGRTSRKGITVQMQGRAAQRKVEAGKAG